MSADWAFTGLALAPRRGGLSNRRFTRLTNAFSKKLENLEHSVALYAMHYNFWGFIKPCASRQRWKQASPIMFGVWMK
jgi:hypothetical protein